MKPEVESELSTLGARDAMVLAGICLPSEQPRAAGHRVRHVLLLRLLGARGSMKRLETSGYLAPGWTVDSLGAHCQVTELGIRVGKAIAVIVNLAPYEGRTSSVGIAIQVLLNRRFQV